MEDFATLSRSMARPFLPSFSLRNPDDSCAVPYLPIGTSALAECLIPASTDTVQERRIDDQFPKRVDQRHVERREQAYAADIDREVEPVRGRCLDQSTQRRGVDGPIDQLDELLVFQAVYNTEKPISRAGCYQRSRTIRVCQTRCEGFRCGCRRLPIPRE